MRRALRGLGFGIWVLGFGVVAATAQTQIKQVLYDMADSIGMLRNANEVDRIGSMNYWATGTITSGGQTCKVVDYKASVNWILKGMRVDYKCEGSAQRHVEVVKENLAWNETEPGKGGTPAAAAANERALLLWTLPAGAIKAANDAGAATKVSTENGKTVVSYPIASLKADVKLTLNKDSHIEQVESRMGSVTTVSRKVELVGQVFNLFGWDNLGGIGSSQIGSAIAPNFGQIPSAQPRQQGEVAIRYLW